MRNPIYASPVTVAPMKPNTAPTSIMPSTPRFRTPDFSHTSSPVAAKISGVAAVIMVITEGMIRSSMFWSTRAPENKPVAGDKVKRQQVEEDDTLKQTGYCFG